MIESIHESIRAPCRAPCPARSGPEGRAGQKKVFESVPGQVRAMKLRAKGQGRAEKSAL